MQVVQATGMVAMAMGHDHEIERGQVDTLGLHVVRKDLGVVAGVEQDALAAILDEGGKPQSFFIVEVLPNAS